MVGGTDLGIFCEFYHNSFEFFGNCLEILWKLFGNSLGIYWEFYRNSLGMYGLGGFECLGVDFW